MPWFDSAEPAIQLLLLLTAGVPAAVVVLVQLLMLPLAAGFEVRAASRRRRGVRTLWDKWPSVSVIVTAHDASSTVGRCIRSIGLTRYARYELILVDDGSTDNTGQLMASAAAADPRIKSLRQPRAGRAAARNLAIRHATGDVLIFVEPDAAVTRRTVDHMLQGFEDPRTGAVAGEGRPDCWPSGGLLASVSYLSAAMIRRALTGLVGLPFPSCGIEAVTTRALAELGPFGEALAEGGPFREDDGVELELVWRVHKAGYRIAFAPLARVHIASASALPALWRRRSRRAHGVLHTILAHPGRGGGSLQGFVLRLGRLLPFIPVYSVFGALSLLAGLARHVGRAERPGKPGPAGSSQDHHDDARRELQETWA